MIWRKAGESHPRLPSPVDCGWECDTTRHHYTQVRSLNHPAPAAVMNLEKCGCKRGCKRTFSCPNNNLPDDLGVRNIDLDERVDDETVYIPCVSIIQIIC